MRKLVHFMETKELFSIAALRFQVSAALSTNSSERRERFVSLAAQSLNLKVEMLPPFDELRHEAAVVGSLDQTIWFSCT